MKFDKSLLRKALRLYAVTDRSWLCGQSLCDCVTQAILGGATFVQIREKNLSEEEFFFEAKILKKTCDKFLVPLVVNDDVQIAKKIDAAGVHIGQSDMALKNAREILGSEKIIGVSVATVEEALLAQSGGADYLGCGSVFATKSKADAIQVSLERVKEICGAVKIPVVAIGGINEKNAALLCGTGVCGICSISSIFSASDIRAAAARLLKIAEKL